MQVFRLKKINAHKELKDLKLIAHEAKFNPVLLFIPGFLAFLSVTFDGLSKSLLIPLIKGVLGSDFNFVRNTPVLKEILSLVPERFASSNASIFIFLLLLIFLTSFLNNLFAYFANTILAYQIRVFSSNLRKSIFARYLSFGKLYFDRANFGHLNNILLDFTAFITNRFIRMQEVFTELSRLVVYLIILLLISWKLTIAILLVFPILHYGLRKIIAMIRSTSGYLAESANNLSRNAFNVLSNIALIKSYNKIDKHKQEFSYLSDLTAKLEFSIDKKINLIKPLQDIFMLFVLVAAILIIGIVVAKSRLSALSAYVVYFYILKSSINSFGSIYIIRSLVAELAGPLDEISKVFNDFEKFFVPGGNIVFPGFSDTIELRNLTFSYQDTKAILNNINLVFKKGQMAALVGSSGGGKTTVVNLLMRFYDCPAGSIFIDGRDLRDFDLGSLRKHFALVSQDTLLFNDTIRNNLIYGLDNAGEEQVVDALKKARLYDFVMSLPKGMETLIGDKGVKLSGGERQRLSIARALLKGSEVLILDEATSSLDSVTEKYIQEAIEEAIKDRTTIVIAHRLSTVRNSDKIIVIENGTVVEQGSLDELLGQKGKFFQYWEEQKFY